MGVFYSKEWERQKALEEAERKRAHEIEQRVKAKEREEQRLREEFRWGPKKPYEWSEEECEKLKKKFQEEPKTPKGHTFLLFGPTSHGKSSFGNGCIAAVDDKDLAPTYHHVRQSSESVSKRFQTKNYKLHRIIDMPGIFEGKATKSEDIRKIVTGQVPWVSKVTATLETPDDQRAQNSTVECIIIILRYDIELPPELKRQIDVIWSLCGEGVLSCHVVLTHLDVCDPQFKDTKNLGKIYDSAKVLKAVERMSFETGIPPYNISFVKNYTTECETDLHSKLQYLRILNTVKESADMVIELRQTNVELAEEYRRQNFDDTIVINREFIFFVAVIVFAILIMYFARN